jgi:hypothetical protein
MEHTSYSEILMILMFIMNFLELLTFRTYLMTDEVTEELLLLPPMQSDPSSFDITGPTYDPVSPVKVDIYEWFRISLQGTQSAICKAGWDNGVHYYEFIVLHLDLQTYTINGDWILSEAARIRFYFEDPKTLKSIRIPDITPSGKDSLIKNSTISRPDITA